MDLLADAIGAATGLLAGRYIVNPLWFRLTDKNNKCVWAFAQINVT